MTTALALYGGYLRVDFVDYQPEALALGHTLWSVTGQHATVLSRHEMAVGEAGITEIHPIDSTVTSVYPPVPPEILPERERSHGEAKG